MLAFSLTLPPFSFPPTPRVFAFLPWPRVEKRVGKQPMRNHKTPNGLSALYRWASRPSVVCPVWSLKTNCLVDPQPRLLSAVAALTSYFSMCVWRINVVTKIVDIALRVTDFRAMAWTSHAACCVYIFSLVIRLFFYSGLFYVLFNELATASSRATDNSFFCWKCCFKSA